MNTKRRFEAICSALLLFNFGCSDEPAARLVDFSTSATAKVELELPAGEARITSAPQLEGQDPYTIPTQSQRKLSSLNAFDEMGRQLLQASESTFKELSASNTDSKVVVELLVSLQGKVDTNKELFASGLAIGRIVFTKDGRQFAEASQRMELTNVVVSPAPPALLRVGSKSTSLRGDLEVEGHSDPNCGLSWPRCIGTGPHCLHIVRDLWTGKCYDEECEWGWYNLRCGCFRDEEVPCPR